MLSTYERIQLQIEGWMSDNLNLKPYKARTKADNEAGLNKGREEGNKVQLSRALQSKNSTKLLGG